MLPDENTGFDFDAAVTSPFRMQPGLRRMAPGSTHLTPSQPGSRHLREKLAVLSAFWPSALCAVSGFDAGPALAALCAQAAAEHPQAFSWDGDCARALNLGAAAWRSGRVEQAELGRFGLGDEIARCLRLLPEPWRLAGLVSLAFIEDFAVVDAVSGTVPWLAVALPSHWAPESKLGRHFAEVHAPVADGDLLRKAGASLMQLVTRSEPGERWERFVWNVTDQPRLNAHPAVAGGPRWQQTSVAESWFRTERQTFIPLPDAQAVFTIAVDVQRLDEVLSRKCGFATFLDPCGGRQPQGAGLRAPGTDSRAAALRAAVASMSPAVLAYRGLTPVRDDLLAWLETLA